MHADRGSRIVLMIVGLIALTLGTASLLAAGGAFGETFAHRRLFDNRFARYFAHNGQWLWPAVAAVALVITVLALIWLRRLLFGTDRTTTIAVPACQLDAEQSPRAGGHTTLQASALTQAVAAEIESYHGVTAARARVLGSPADPLLAIDVTASRRADLPALVRRIQQEAISHAREALERAHLPVKLDIAVTDRGAARTS